MQTTSKLGFQPSGRVYLLLAIAIFGAANAVTRKLTELGEMYLIDGRNPISFCNVLFVGNLCALILLAITYGREWRQPALQQIKWQDWLSMSVVAILGAAIVPTLIFTALAITPVNNVILISQIDTPLVLALSVWVLGDRVNKWVVAGAVVSFIGVALTVLIQPPGTEMISMSTAIGQGAVLTLIAAVIKAIANLISKISLREIPLGIFSVFRMFVGTVFFFGATIVLYGSEHFMDVGSKFLWQWMLFYAAIIVVAGQSFWFNGLKRSTASEVSFATAFNPIVGILSAFILLSEVPTLGQYIGGVVILGGIFLNQVGVQRLNLLRPSQRPSTKEMSESGGFKGV
ncbi:membrane protein [Leptolyngbya sp. Heron Island J]|uniref:DMT family transporter n=1 Tax=Leptolyngbya sp. Heron Island J TaxID=1385935 RepID=UPI0003B95923|nr:DMT family transporter [Leptolyngbya sp. Heron Island J]ESA32099.1 membrane protein [Leptolyngbya sp. Heron Island J]